MPFRAPQFVRSNESSLFAVIGCRCRPCAGDRKSTRLNSSHSQISYAVFCLKKKILLHHSVPCHPRPESVLANESACFAAAWHCCIIEALNGTSFATRLQIRYVNHRHQCLLD